MSTSAAVARSLVQPTTEIQETAKPASPFVKWVGGKGRVLPSLLPLLPPGVERMRHVEPFVGGGAFFFHRQPRRALLSDVNPALVSTYQVVQKHVDELIDCLKVHADLHSSEHYYAMRTRYNHEPSLTPIEKASLFIYMNKTCFNGLFRLNRKGEFNVPIGGYVRPSFQTLDELLDVQDALQGVSIHTCSYEQCIDWADSSALVYFDPPYRPLTKTSGFVSYSKDDFDDDDQRALAQVFRELDSMGARLILSNSDPKNSDPDDDFFDDLYSGFNIERIMARRAINSNPAKRGDITEIIVTN